MVDPLDQYTTRRKSVGNIISIFRTLRRMDIFKKLINSKKIQKIMNPIIRAILLNILKLYSVIIFDISFINEFTNLNTYDFFARSSYFGRITVKLLALII